MEQPREGEQEGRFEAENEYVTVPQLAKKLHLSPKTIYNWIQFGDIGEADGIFDVHGRMLIHWPTFRSRQFNLTVLRDGFQPRHSFRSSTYTSRPSSSITGSTSTPSG